MKKLVLAVIIALLVSLIGVAWAVNGAAGVNVTVNGKTVNFPDAKPFIDENGRTLLPVRFVTEELGAKVEWNANEQKVYIRKDATTITIKINDKDIVINGLIKRMDTKAIIKEDRTFVPIRYTAESLGATVGWNESTKTVNITTGHTPISTPTPTNSPVAYDPSKWVSVDYEGGEDCYLYLNVEWNPNQDEFIANCDYAEAAIAKKYNSDIAKKVMDIAKKKTAREIIFVESIKYEGKIVDIEVFGSSISVTFWKEGIS